MIRASREVSERKAATQSGFKKFSYPHFNGDVLNYLEFKKHSAAEVIPERKPPALELVHSPHHDIFVMMVINFRWWW